MVAVWADDADPRGERGGGCVLVAWGAAVFSADVAERVGHRSSRIGAELGGVPFNTVKDWLYRQQRAVV